MEKMPIQNKFDWKKVTFHKLDSLEWVAIILFWWLIIYPKPYQLLVGVTLLLPILGFVINGLKGRPSIASLVQIKNTEDEKYDVADFIDLPSYALTLRVLLDFEFDNFKSMLLPGLLGTVIVLLILLSTHRFIVMSKNNKWWIYISLFFNVFLYSFSATYAINCVYDNSEAKVYSAKVVDKHISEGRRHTTYYLKVTPWGHFRDPENISVSMEKYNQAETGQYVNIDLKEGVFNIPWYYIE